MVVYEKDKFIVKKEYSDFYNDIIYKIYEKKFIGNEFITLFIDLETCKKVIDEFIRNGGNDEI